MLKTGLPRAAEAGHYYQWSVTGRNLAFYSQRSGKLNYYGKTNCRSRAVVIPSITHQLSATSGNLWQHEGVKPPFKEKLASSSHVVVSLTYKTTHSIFDSLKFDLIWPTRNCCSRYQSLRNGDTNLTKHPVPTRDKTVLTSFAVVQNSSTDESERPKVVHLF